MNILVFDIETIPDIDTGRRLLDLENESREKVIEKMLEKRRTETDGSDFLPHHLHRIVTISLVLKTPDVFNVWSLGTTESSEKDLIERFWSGLEKYIPTLVSWNGAGFDLPVLHYRSLLHGISCPRYWETGEKDPSFKWNNYLNRYHARHTDLMDVLANYQGRAVAKLDEIAVMLGLPGKMGMSGGKVYERYLQGDLEGIRHYCEFDVLNTYLIYQRFRTIQGRLPLPQYEQAIQETQTFLSKAESPHWKKFLEAWIAPEPKSEEKQ